MKLHEDLSMDPQIVTWQKAQNYFALLGVPGKYALTDEQVQSAAAAVVAKLEAFTDNSDPAMHAAIDQIHTQVDQATRTLLDPVERGEYLLKLYDAAKDANAVPPDFHDTLAALQSEMAGAVAARDDERLIRVREHAVAERQKHLGRVAECFAFPRNVPNPVAQEARDFAARTELNAVRLLDQLLKEL